MFRYNKILYLLCNLALTKVSVPLKNGILRQLADIYIVHLESLTMKLENKFFKEDYAL